MSLKIDKYQGPKSDKLKSDLRSIFESCFTEDWDTCVPYSDDATFVASQNGKIVGFVMIHEPPYKFPVKDHGMYFYNLCVLEKYRNEGVATALLEKIKSVYNVLHCHILTKDPWHDWLKKQGFSSSGVWNRVYVEYTYPTDIVVEDTTEVKKATELLNMNYYDPYENIVYCQPLV